LSQQHTVSFAALKACAGVYCMQIHCEARTLDSRPIVTKP